MSEFRILEGDCLARLADLPDRSVQTCVTSPPYWGLRDYGTATWDGGDPECEHRVGGQVEDGKAGGAITAGVRPGVDASRCLDCGAKRIDSQLGLEPTPEQYVANLVAVFREVRRVLRDDGTLWLNLGDSYAGSWGAQGRGGPPSESSTLRGNGHVGGGPKAKAISAVQIEQHPKRASNTGSIPPGSGLKPKDLVGIPWMVAFALRADGWYLRSDIIWAKPNPMPESVTDRPTKAHEYLFLLTKGPRYFYDADAIQEDAIHAGETVTLGPKSLSVGQATGMNREPSGNGKADSVVVAAGRNKRSVWTVTTQPFPGAHFATFPPKLIEPCILAGSRPVGAMDEPELIETPTGERSDDPDPSIVTGRAGMNRPRGENEGRRPITRAEQVGYAEQLRNSPHRGAMEAEAGEAFAHYVRTDRSGARPVPPRLLEAWIERGWLDREPVPMPTPADRSTATVLDPFNGAGTTGLVALRHDRDYIGIELNPEYAQMARDRIYDDAPLLNMEAA